MGTRGRRIIGSCGAPGRKGLVGSGLAVAAALLLGWQQVAAQAVHALTVDIENLETDTVQVFVSLFASEDAFLREPLDVLQQDVEAASTLRFEFGESPAGTYGISVVYDKNGNGETDTGFFRIPKEPIGFSNNARGRFGPPKWNAVSFELESLLHLSIRVAGIRDD